RLVGDLHQLSQFDARVSRLDVAPVDLGALVGRLVAVYGPEFAQRGLALREACGNLPVVEADADLVSQALRNLIDNALRYAPPGGVVQPAAAGPRQPCGDPILITAVIFDLDGLIIDSETPDVLAWQAVYTKYDLSFPVDSWLQNIGRTDGPFDPYVPFRRPESPVTPEAVAAIWRDHHDRLIDEYFKPLPGVVPL